MKVQCKALLLLLMAVVAAGGAAAQSGLNSREFARYWQVESEAADYKVSFSADTCELLAPKGLTLWRKQKMEQGTTVEYDVQVVVQTDGDRLSDMNAFWMASDPTAPDIWRRSAWRQGIFARCYSLQMYYLGFGGNHNTTTRFRRYTGNDAAVADETLRPAILKEFTDEAHLLKANHWYHVKIESAEGRTRFFVDGELLVSYLDPEPLASGWFGFRTTLSRTRITNFRSYKSKTSGDDGTVPLRWMCHTSPHAADTSRAELQPVTFGVPFRQGELTDVDRLELADGTPADFWVSAWWPDGSVKWAAVAAVADRSRAYSLRLKSKSAAKRSARGREKTTLTVSDEPSRIVVNTGSAQVFLPKSGAAFIDSIVVDSTCAATGATLVATTSAGRYVSELESASVERLGRHSAVVRLDGVHRVEGSLLADGAPGSWLPFTLRLYFFGGSSDVKLVHTFLYDGNEQRDVITSIGLQFRVPMHGEEAYNRHVAFAMDADRVWSEPVQPLDGRRELRLKMSPSEEGRGIPSRNMQLQQMGGERIPPRQQFDALGQSLIDNWASWDGFRLSQLTDNSFSIRKRATASSPWIGTLTGMRSPGYAFLGSVSGGLGVALEDFWQSYPSTLEVSQARSSEAMLTVYLWSPEAEPMNLCHYDTIAHGLNESYEDVQPGMSTPFGIGRTSTLWLFPQKRYAGPGAVSSQTARLETAARLLPTPEYLHSRRAFGVWSLPSGYEQVESRLDFYIKHYQREVERRKWYGFWNYGDVMHAYDPERDEWRYDVGGYAWDNTELASPMWLWYSFLRTGRADIWRMAEAMTRHNSEVDTYHIGLFAPLGTRHNVSHWGCGAKEARISQSAFLRFYYYLTADNRTGDIMHQQTDADTLLWHLDPMRLAEPREKFPCSAPARLRIGPDWMAYAGNWMTEWERTSSTLYRNKIAAGMESIAQLADGLFTGNKALGYDPATGHITYDGPDSLRNTNHLLTIMGGFEVMNELMPMMPVGGFAAAWADHARRYREMALNVSKNKFPVRRLDAFAAWTDRDPMRAGQTWQSLLRPSRGISTNDAALWSLDAIYMLETLHY